MKKSDLYFELLQYKTQEIIKLKHELAVYRRSAYWEETKERPLLNLEIGDTLVIFGQKHKFVMRDRNKGQITLEEINEPTN